MHTLLFNNFTCRYLYNRNPCTTISGKMFKNIAFLYIALKFLKQSQSYRKVVSTIQKAILLEPFISCQPDNSSTQNTLLHTFYKLEHSPI